MKKLYFICALSFIAVSAFSQITFVKGYIIQPKGDTIHGEIKINPKKEYDNYSKVFFKDENNVQKFHKPDKIKGYGYEGHQYISSEFEGDPSFYRVIVDGEIMLLDILFEMMQMNTTTFKNEYYMAHKGDEEFTRIKTNKFKKQLNEFMKDKPEIAANADDKFEIENAIEVFKQYNGTKP